MARRRRPEGASPAIYQAVLDRRNTGPLARYRARLGAAPLRPWPKGEPIEVYGWELPGRARAHGVHPNQRVLVHPDGRIERVDNGR